MKLLPAIITLLAGACTSIITYLVHYEVKKALWILLIVLILFYIIGIVVQKVIYKFEQQVEQEEIERAEREGKVVEKDIPNAGDGESSEQSGNPEAPEPENNGADNEMRNSAEESSEDSKQDE